MIHSITKELEAKHKGYLHVVKPELVLSNMIHSSIQKLEARYIGYQLIVKLELV
jgi:hypothetical protein